MILYNMITGNSVYVGEDTIIKNCFVLPHSQPCPLVTLIYTASTTDPRIPKGSWLHVSLLNSAGID